MKTQAKKKDCPLCSRTVQSLNPLQVSYQKDNKLSNAKLKERIGELLLCLQTPLGKTERQQYRQQFEITLRGYIDLKLNEVNYGANRNTETLSDTL